MSDSKTRMPAGWTRTPWVPPREYTSGPHRWAIVWTGRAHVWVCRECGHTPTGQADVTSDCAQWRTWPS